jgi:hypothetical protein
MMMPTCWLLDNDVTGNQESGGRTLNQAAYNAGSVNRFSTIVINSPPMIANAIGAQNLSSNDCRSVRSRVQGQQRV